MITGQLEITNPRMDDERRTIRELSSIEGGFAAQRFEIRETQKPLGKHAHRFKSECFIITHGRGYFLVAPIDSQGNILGAPRKVAVSPDTVICFNRLEAHTLYPEEAMGMVCFSNQPFFDEDNDFVDCPDLVIEKFPELVH